MTNRLKAEQFFDEEFTDRSRREYFVRRLTGLLDCAQREERERVAVDLAVDLLDIVKVAAKLNPE